MKTVCKNHRLWRYLGFLVVLLACSAITIARQDNRDTKDEKEEHSQKTSQKQRNSQDSKQKSGVKKKESSRPNSSRPSPRSPKQQQTTAGNPRRQNPTGQSQPEKSRGYNGERRGNSGRQPSRMRAGGKPAAKNQPRAGRGDDSAKHRVSRYSKGAPRTIRVANGGVVRKSASGHIVEVRTPRGAVIRHTPAGVRRIEVVRPGNRVIVTTGRHFGYVQKPLIIARRRFVQRTYVSHGRIFTRVYRPVIFRGVRLHIYTPVRYYRPAFYFWALNPWPRTIIFTWGWGRAPWYGFYGGYFVPYRSYPSPVFWLTDFVISTTMQAAYEERVAAATTPPPAMAVVRETELTPEVKQLIAEEVRRQIELERAESRNIDSPNYNTTEVPPMFADNGRHTFVVSNALLVNSGSRECTLSEGDVIQTLGIPPMDSPVADAGVLASKPTECRKGSVVSVQLTDLQEMQNHMRETVERGLGDLQSRSGQSGLPAPPPQFSGTTETPLAAEIHPDENVQQELSLTEQEADETEQDVIDQSAIVDGKTETGPVTISLGETIDEVVAAQGQPQTIVNLDNKKIYVYPDIKITFMDGRVSDVE